MHDFFAEVTNSRCWDGCTPWGQGYFCEISGAAVADSKVKIKAPKVLWYCIKTTSPVLLEGIYSQGRDFPSRG